MAALCSGFPKVGTPAWPASPTGIAQHSRCHAQVPADRAALAGSVPTVRAPLQAVRGITRLASPALWSQRTGFSALRGSRLQERGNTQRADALEGKEKREKRNPNARIAGPAS